MSKYKKQKLIKILSPEMVKAYTNKINVDSFISKAKPNKANFKKCVSEYAEHFKTDAWPLDVNHVQAILCEELFGLDISKLFIKQLQKNGVDIGIGEKDNILVYFINKPKKKGKSKK